MSKESPSQSPAHHRRLRYSLKLEVLAQYGGTSPTCARCGFTDIRALCVDHVDGGGNQERREVGHSNLYPSLKQRGFPKGYQILCANCNLIKAFEKGELG
jgi:hypothetical protein